MIKFNISSDGGVISKGGFGSKDIPIADLNIRGEFKNGPASMDLEHLSLKLGDSKVALNGLAIGVEEGINIDGRASINTVEVSHLKDYWYLPHKAK